MQQKSSLRLYDNRASPVSWDPSIMMIPGGNFLGNHACWASRRMDQARNRTVGNTLFMRIASLRAVLWRSARQTFASLGLFLGYVRTYCVPITTLTQNKRTWLLYLGDAQIITLKVVTTLFALASRNNATIRTKAFTLIVQESWRQFFKFDAF